MSCVPLTADHCRVLELLSQNLPVPNDLASALDDLRRWSWVMGTDELTGVGWAHVGDLNRGVLGGR